ncbi:glycoside hydrolase family 15 protein [candidate division KSB1 bacterium]|nr:glycoside hydrolase family 15 protein [candidate division KSB1 bacterium]
MPYQPIENYGIIGDLHSVALVGMNGSIDWLCFPHFDSPSIFAAILDDQKGGRFKIAPTEEDVKYKQIYLPDTNILVTRFHSEHGVGEITDFMPIFHSDSRHKPHQLARSVTAVRGSMQFRMQCQPAFNYSRDEHEVSLNEKNARFDSPSLSVILRSNRSLKKEANSVYSEFELNEGETAIFLLHEPEIELTRDLEQEVSDLFHRTVGYWRNWIAGCTYKGRWREMVYRSALTLKLLTYEPTGAIVAAPTCSLPENIGGERNWDYRFSWIRDAAFTLYALIRIGFTGEAARFMKWLGKCTKDLNEDGSLPIMFGLDGRRVTSEEILEHFEGYRGSQPVRIGNNAADQLQLDIYGELMDSVYLYNKYGSPISYDFWNSLRPLVNYVCENWDKKDEGIWEVRGGRQHFVYSKLMCWVALDRAIRLAKKRSFPAPLDKWLSCRDTIYEDIIRNGWNSKIKAFVQSYGSKTLDSANLLMPLVFFLSPVDPRMLNTLDAINRSPEKGGLVSNSMVYRYNIIESPDGLGGNEGTFNICTFWLVEALARAGRFDKQRLEEARLIFEKMLSYSNHLGLYAEEIGNSGEGLGNFPQAFTHLSLISSAFNLDRALNE